MNVLLDNPDRVTLLHKGEDAQREEYSIFKNSHATERILRILEEHNPRQIDICGLAGDVCVADTIRDALTLPLTQKLDILTPYTPSIDGGSTLDSIISQLPGQQ